MTLKEAAAIHKDNEMRNKKQYKPTPEEVERTNAAIEAKADRCAICGATKGLHRDIAQSGLHDHVSR